MVVGDRDGAKFVGRGGGTLVIGRRLQAAWPVLWGLRLTATPAIEYDRRHAALRGQRVLTSKPDQSDDRTQRSLLTSLWSVRISTSLG